MDEIVEAAIAKWPRVPHCFGWLALDARGDWYLRDDAVQAAGAFPEAKGSRIEHAVLKRFIERNYESDPSGCWYFQNGPQRVYVELEAAPLVLRIGDAGNGIAAETHTGRPATVQALWIDEGDRLFAETDAGFAIVHSLDTGAAADAIEAAIWSAPRSMAFTAMPGRFGYVTSPKRPVDAG